MTVTRKEQLTGKEIICPDCGQKTSGPDRCMRCGSPLLKDSEVGRPQVEDLVSIGEARKKAQENLQTILAEQRVRRQAKLKAYGVKVVGKIEHAPRSGSGTRDRWKRCLETYPVNEPYAHIAIVASPSSWHICRIFRNN